MNTRTTMLGTALSLYIRSIADEFMADTAHFRSLSNRTLDRILAQNSGVEWGRRHGLDCLEPRRVFETLPLTTYGDYAPYIERMAAGEQQLLCGEPLSYFAVTSGTTGPQKIIPVTRRQMWLNGRTTLLSMGLGLRAGLLKPMRGPLIVLLTEHAGGKTAAGVPRGAAISGSFRYFGSIADQLMAAPSEVIRVRDQATARYLHLLFAIGERRPWTILSFFPATLLFALRDLQARAETLLRDLADGTLNPELELPVAARQRLLERLRRNPHRARALTALLENGRFTVPEIWPELTAILTATGGSFRFYRDQLRPFLGNLPVFSPLYGASEAMIGLGYSAARDDYLMLPGPAYIELLPVEEAAVSDARPIPASDAKPGRCYEIVVTTLAGLTRYRLDDIVRVVDFHGQTPLIEFVERHGQIIDVIGEKTAEHHIVEAVEKACRSVNAPLVDYFVTPDAQHQPARYLLVIEALQGDFKEADLLLRAVEAELCRTSPDYAEERELGTLANMAAVLLKPGAFERIRAQRIAAGAAPSQVKTPHVIPDPAFATSRLSDEILLRVEAKSA